MRHVGDAVAFVVADTLDAAKDAAEAIEIEWQQLPHVIGAVAALKPGAPKVWADRADNLSSETEVGDARATKEAFASAAHIVELTIVNQRLVTNYLDTRGVVAEYDGERYTLTLGSQGSHIIRDIIGAAVMKLPPEKMRVVTPDVGGGFGTKLFPYREYALAAVASERVTATGQMGLPSEPNIFSAIVTAATTSPPRGWQSTTRGVFSRLNSTSSPTWAPTCRATRLTSPGSGSAWRRAHTIFPLPTYGCALPIPTPFRSMPIGVPDGRKPHI